MIRRTLIVACIAVLAAALPVGPAPAGTGTTFTFYGSAWGHGIGFAQWGGYGLALEGWTHEEILAHFYTGTTIGPTPFTPTRVRVGIVQAQPDIHVKAEAAPVELRLGGPGGALVATIPKGRTWTIEVEDSRYRIVNAKGAQVGGAGTLWGSTTEHLFARYAPLGARAFIAETGNSYNRGWIEFNIYGCAGCAKLIRLVVSVPPEQYLYGVAEVYSGWPLEALRAQAVTSRTFAFEKIQRLGQNRPVCNCGVFGTTTDQVYKGWTKEGGSFGERWVQAVDETAGRVVLYDGELIQAYFFASSGGHTEDNENVWGGTPLPYLRGVCDTGDWRPDNPYRAWSVQMTAAEAGDRVSSYLGRDIGDVVAFRNIVRGVSGRIVSVLVDGTKDDATLSGPGFKNALGLYESKVWINTNRNVLDEIRERYDALDCAPGLPTTPSVAIQDGHRQRFQDGALYHNHLRDTVRWLHGEIYERYRDMGEASSVLGLPVSGIRRLSGREGSKALFEGGRIFWSPSTGAHALWGYVLAYFAANGGVGRFGLPVTDVVGTDGGGTTSGFEAGAITCDAKGSCTGP